MDGSGQQQQTVNLRVQVIDMNSFTLDLTVPTYLPARDLTQRVARDAGLDAYWGDGRRRLYWLRARGRLLTDDERLGDLGVVPGELVYLLPEPPAGSGVLEQPPDYPATRGYAGKGTLALLGSLMLVVLWAAGWGVALAAERTGMTVMVPGLAMGILCTGFARHAWGGRGSAPRIAITAMVTFLLTLVLAFLAPVVINHESPAAVYSESVSGMIFGMVGVMLSWLAWWGAVEPLPAVQEQQAQQGEAAVAVVQCGICGGDVTADVRCECAYGCGRYFHVGCYRARTSVYRGDPKQCAICNARVA
jgi:uncharacterized ubiquitin-like protein YukD